MSQTEKNQSKASGFENTNTSKVSGDGKMAKTKSKADSALLSPAALLALGLVGTSVEAARMHSTEHLDAPKPEGQPPQSPLTTDVVVSDAPGPQDAGLQQQLAALIQEMRGEQLSGLASAEVGVAPVQTMPASDAGVSMVLDNPQAVVLAQASSTSAGAPAAAAPAATAEAAGAAAATAASGVSAGAVLAGIAALAVVGSGSSSGGTPKDTVAPTATITMDDTALKAGDTATVTITFSEAVTGFASADDVTVENGTLSAMTSADGGVTWTGTFTPTADLEDASNSISLAATYTDVAGNAGTVAASGNYAIDTKAPTATITMDDTALKAGDTATVTITFSEAVTGFESANDVTVEHGTLSAMTSADGGVTWTGTFTPTADLEDASNSISLAATYTDVAGNAGTVATSDNYAIDNVAPTLQLLEAHSADKTVVLTFNEALDEANLPATTEFAVTTGGAANPVASVSASGATLTLTLTNAFAAGAVNVTYTPVAGDQTNAVQDAAGNDFDAGFSSGILADGYIRDAKVYIDTNGNGEVDADSDFYVGTTDDNGNFFLPSDAPSGTIIAIGGVNIDTGLPNTTALKAPAGSTSINPLTTLVQAVVDASGGETDAAAAASEVASALGLNLPAGSSLTNYDPIAAGDVSVQKAAAQIATVIALADTGGADGAGESVIANLAEQVDNFSGTAIDLSDSGTLTAVLADAGLDTAEISEAVDASAAIASATSVSEVSAAQSQFLDRIAPAAPSAPDLAAASDSGSSSTDNITNLTSVTVRIALNTTATDGTAVVVGDTVRLTDAGVQVGIAVLSATDVKNGYVDISVSGLSAGAHGLAATASDQAGNTSSASAALSLTVDTTAPAKPTIGLIAGNDVLSGSEQSSSIAGTAEANASLTIGLGGTTHTVTASSSGVWSYALTAADITAMGQGAETISVTAKDAAGNTSAAATRAITIDTVAPTASAAITGAADNVDPTTGNVVSGGSSNDNTLGLSGTVSELGAGEVLVVYDGATRLGVATFSSGTWSYTTPSLSNSAHSFTVQAEDAAGNKGSASAAYTVTVDATVPAGTASITTPADGALGNTSTPTLEGTNSALASGEQVIVFDNGERLGVATVTDTSWTFTTGALAEGAHSFEAVIEGSGGNQGAASSAVTLTIDSTAPDAPVINTVATDNVISDSEKTASVSGSAEAGATITLTLGSGNERTVTADADGNWSYSLDAADIAAMGQGAETVSASAADAAGNVGSAGTLDISIDTAAPEAPVFNTVASDSTINAAEKTAGVSITGTAEAGANIALVIGSAVRSITADSTGAWSYKLVAADYTAMGQGAETLSATATDAVGNPSSTSTATISVDTAAPVLIAQLDAASDTGVANDGKSSDTTPTVKGFSEAGTTISISAGGTALGSTVADASGAWTLTSAALPNDGSYQFTLSAADAAGNTTSRSVAYVLDTTAPSAPTIAAVATDNVINAAEQSAVVSGAAEAYAKVSLSIGGSVRAVNADATGKWAYTLTAADITAMGQGAETLSVTSTDAAGNVSAAGSRAITVDTVAPELATIALIDVNSGNPADRLTNDNTPVLTVTAEAGATLKVGQNGVETTVPYTVVESSTTPGSYTITFSESLADGTYGVRVIDQAGNASALLDGAQTYKFTIDTQAPTPPQITAIDNDSGAAGDHITKDNTPVLTVTAESGMTLVMGGENGKPLNPSMYSVVESSTNPGSYTVTVNSALPDGGYGLVAVDAAGNISTVPTELGASSFMVDATAPELATIASIDANSGNPADRLTNDGTPTLVVTAEAGATLKVGQNGVETTVPYTVVESSTTPGSYTITFSESLADGTYGVGVIDQAGNASALLDGAQTYKFTVDSLAPALAQITAIDVNSGSTADRITNDNTPVLTVTAEAGAMLKVGQNGVETTVPYTVVESSTTPGSYTITFSESLADGTYGVRVTDQAGNASALLDGTQTYKFVIDTIKPSTPSITAMDVDSGTAGDRLTSDRTPTLTVTAETGMKLVVGSGGQDAGGYEVTESSTEPGTYTITFSQDLADKTYSVVAIDSAGNKSEAAVNQLDRFTIDATASTSVVSITGAEDNVPASPVSNIVAGTTTNDNTPTLQGTLSSALNAGETVVVFDGDTRLGTASIDGTDWKLVASSLGNGEHSFTALVEDAAGNQGAASSAYAFTIDATVPTATATLTGATDNQDAIAGNVEDGGLTNDATLALSGAIVGTLGTGEAVKVFDGDALLGQATVNEARDGWTYTTPELSEGDHSFKVLVENAGGNQGAISDAYNVTLDLTAPDVLGAEPEGQATVINDVKYIDSNTFTLTNLEEGARAQITHDGGLTWVDIEGKTFTLQDGQYQSEVGIRQIDAAGNIGPASMKDVVTVIDTLAPALAQITSIADNSGSTADRITNDNTPVLTVTAEAGAKLVLGHNNQPVEESRYTVQESVAGGTYTITLNQGEVLADGGYGVVVLDKAGNYTVPTAGSAATFLIDTVKPNTPSITAMDVDSGTAGDRLTSDRTPTLTVTAETGMKLVVGSGGQDAGGYEVTESSTTPGTYTITFGQDLLDGTYGIRAIDNAGNKSDVSGGAQPYNFTIDGAPTLSIDPGDVANGTVTFKFAFSEAVTGFDISDINFTGQGTPGTLTTIDASHYTLAITPAATTVPQAISVTVAAGAAQDSVGNASGAASFEASVMFGTSGDDTLSLGAEPSFIWTGASKDVIKVTAESAGAEPSATLSNVIDFDPASDKIDLSAILGEGGAGYTGLTPFFSIANGSLVNGGKTVKFSVMLDSESFNGGRIEGLTINLGYDYSNIQSMTVKSAVVKNSDGTDFLTDPSEASTTVATWSPVIIDKTTGKITGTQNFLEFDAQGIDQYSTHLTNLGKAFDVTLTLKNAVSSFDVVFDTDFGFANTVSIPDGDMPVTVQDSPSSISSSGLAADPLEGMLSVVQDVETLGTVGDNELHAYVSYDEAKDVTTAFVRFDTDSALDSTTESSVLALAFDGDLTESLTPANLIFI
jgi:hypothetical protein